MRKMFWAFLGAIVFVIVLPFNSFGNGTANDSTPFCEAPPGFEFELEYLTPLLDKRKIDTLSLNVLKETSNNDHFSFYYGFTITRAWGEIFYHQKTLTSSAFGIGPVWQMRDNIFQGIHSSLTLDMSVGIILYNEDFPADGRVYNFMWRMGPKFRYQLTNHLVLNFGYKWMHVSNGHFLGDHNPAYNAGGYSLSLTKKL